MIGYLYDPIFLAHDTGMHIEIPKRIKAIDAMVQSKYNIIPIPTRNGDKSELYKIHEKGYVEWLEHAHENGIHYLINSDTIISEKSYEVAKIAATSTKNVIDAFKSGKIKRAFLNLRPPGHHAEHITGQGFCLFNNIALMAKYAQEAGFEKVMIIDFDVHHGNGTQDIFYSDESVYFFSTHEGDNYPYFVGEEAEIGEGSGEGFTENHPYDFGINDESFSALFDTLPQTFDFDIVLVSAGYDLMAKETISSTQITLNGIETMLEKILDFTADKPIAFLLEGGYNIDSLVSAVDLTIQKLVDYEFQ